MRTGNGLYVEYATGERELYDLGEDPYQLDNRYGRTDPESLRRLEGRLAALRGCSGSGCRAAEEGPPREVEIGMPVGGQDEDPAFAVGELGQRLGVSRLEGREGRAPLSLVRSP